MPTLYLVATPIGNLEDITLRALRVLREVGLIAAEDTRTTRKLLARYGIKTPLTSYNEHNKRAKTPYILDTLKSRDVALVSEAGMPGISDPGYDLLLAAIREGIEVVPIPGPSALTTALAISGLPTHQFLYIGFLPSRSGERVRLLESIATERRTILAFEAPHRLRESLADILKTLGDRRIAVCREMTKLHEEVFRGTVSEALAHFQEPRGEFTLVVEGAPEREAVRDTAWAREALRRLRMEGRKAREAVDRVAAASGLPRREVYRLWLELKE
jgi:16S rRNA (cytidine1402-2'-O)-methyltransferase